MQALSLHALICMEASVWPWNVAFKHTRIDGMHDCWLRVAPGLCSTGRQLDRSLQVAGGAHASQHLPVAGMDAGCLDG